MAENIYQNGSHSTNELIMRTKQWLAELNSNILKLKAAGFDIDSFIKDDHQIGVHITRSVKEEHHL